MRNVTLPTLSSQLYYLGNNEVRMPDFGALNTMSVNRRPFCLETNFPDAGNQLMHEGFTLPYESFNNVQAGFQYAPSSFYDTLQQPMIPSNNVSVPGNEMDQAMQNRKRSIESTTNIFAKRDVPVAVLTELKKNKRKKAIPTEAQWQNQVLQPESVNIQVHKLHVPVRRSQKLSDKITALQKLVSPYGKTDTASVLQEASLYIKLLQEQIQDLFQMLNSSNNSMSPLHCSQGHDGNLLDLRSRGLCLVPISLMQKAALGRL